MSAFEKIFGGGKPNIQRMGKKRDIDGLTKALKYGDYFIQSNAISALRDIKYAPEEFDEKVLGHLIVVMEKEKNIPGWVPDKESGFWRSSLCCEAMDVIISNSTSIPNKAIEILIKDTEKGESGSRKEAYTELARSYSSGSLSEVNKEKIFDILENGLKNEFNSDVLKTISYSLSTWVYPNLKLEDRITPYYSFLSDNDENVRDDAASYLLKYCGIDGLRALIKALNSENKNAYLSAAWALAYDLKNYKSNMDKNELKMALTDANKTFIDVVQSSELLPGTNYFNEYVIRALNALREIGDLSVMPALKKFQNRVQEKFNEEGMRTEYVQTRDYGGTISSDSNIAEVKDVIESIKTREAELYVKELREKKDIDGLILLLKDDNEMVRLRTAENLGDMGEPAVEPLILALMDDREKGWRARRGAAKALGKIGDKRAVEPLIQALEDNDSGTRKAAKEALEKIKESKEK